MRPMAFRFGFHALGRGSVANLFCDLTDARASYYVMGRNNPGSFGEGAQSRPERVGSCYFLGGTW
jgi:hypothetical protein